MIVVSCQNFHLCPFIPPSTHYSFKNQQHWPLEKQRHKGQWMGAAENSDHYLHNATTLWCECECEYVCVSFSFLHLSIPTAEAFVFVII